MTFDEFMEERLPGVWGITSGGPASDLPFSVRLLQDVWDTAQRQVASKPDDTGPPGVVMAQNMPFVSKRWGWELWVVNNDRYCGKKLFVKQGHWLSYHYHSVKDEVLFVESGSAKMAVGETDSDYPRFLTLLAGNAYHVTPGLRHQIEAVTDAVIFEFSTHHSDNDSIRVTTDLLKSSTHPARPQNLPPPFWSGS